MIYFITEQNISFDGIVNCSVEDCLQYLSTINYISIDSETAGFDVHTKELLLLQVGDKHNQYVIDCTTIDIFQFKTILESKPTIAHNMKFDWKFMYAAGIDLKKFYDTFLIECILTTGYDNDSREVSLNGVGNKYLNKDIDKSVRGSIHKGITKEVIEYAATDIMYLEDILSLQLVEIRKWNLIKVLTLEMQACRVFAKMEYDGIGFDKSKINEVIEELKVINAKITNDLDNIVLENTSKISKLNNHKNLFSDLDDYEGRKVEINWNSHAQKVKVLNDLGFNVDSVADKVLKQNAHKHKIFSLLNEQSKFAKLSSSFGHKLLSFVNPKTNRIHANTWQILQTGRISQQDPNLLQIPSHSELGRKIKACFIPKKGYKFVSGDFSGIELRIIAEYSQDPLWLKTFRDNGDLHSILCTETFNIPIEDVKKPFPFNTDITYRFLQKTINFGISYGMSKFKLSETAQISVGEADKIIKKFFSKVPRVEKILSLWAKTAVKNGYIRTNTTYNRIRWFPNLDRDNFKSIGEVERAAKNSIPQSTNADVMKETLIRLQQIIDDNNYPVNILLSIHDEVLTECKESFANEWKEILEKTMIKSAQMIIKSIPVKVDGVISDYWTD
jgi:DNA polymerase I